ncbi:HNH endonuclease [Microbacterium phage Tempo]|nr:HNH endonuclease [Microbacterium phage Tempo]WNT44264.1 HNH endonuclease [Microbacterium phage CandC]
MGSSRDASGKLRRGTSNSNDRGSASERRKRKCWMLSWFGDGITCLCYSCGTVLLYSTLEADRIIPGVLGGTYARGNIRPSCGPCNRRGGNAVKKLIRQKVPLRTILRMCRNGEL